MALSQSGRNPLGYSVMNPFQMLGLSSSDSRFRSFLNNNCHEHCSENDYLVYSFNELGILMVCISAHIYSISFNLTDEDPTNFQKCYKGLLPFNLDSADTPDDVVRKLSNEPYYKSPSRSNENLRLEGDSCRLKNAHWEKYNLEEHRLICIFESQQGKLRRINVQRLRDKVSEILEI